MKSELKEILMNESVEELKKYLQNNKRLDYTFNIKLGDYSHNVNILVYSLLSNKHNFVKCLLENLDNLKIKDLLSGTPYFVSYSYLLKDENYNNQQLKLIYNNLNGDFKKDINKVVKNFTLKEIYDNGLKFLLDKKDLLEIIIKEDDVRMLKIFIHDNKNYNFLDKVNNKSYLILCMENNSVLCFDFLKEHIKNIKLSNIMESVTHDYLKNKVKF